MNNISKLVIIGSVAITLSSCGDSWLEPKPLSFYSPENTLVDAKGMWAALGRKGLKRSFMEMDLPLLPNIFFLR